MSLLQSKEAIVHLLEIVQEVANNIDLAEQESPEDFAIARELVDQLQEELQSLFC